MDSGEIRSRELLFNRVEITVHVFADKNGQSEKVGDAVDRGGMLQPWPLVGTVLGQQHKQATHLIGEKDHTGPDAGGRVAVVLELVEVLF